MKRKNILLKSLAKIVVACYVISTLILVKQPLAVSNSLALNENITKWLLSSDSNYIYAVASNTGQLFCINANDMTIKKTIKVGTTLQDVYLYNGIIYISIPNAKQIVTIDEATLSIKTRYNTTADAYSIAVEDGKLIYATQTWFSYIYELDLTTGVDKLTNLGIVGEPDLEIDPVKHILYVGESDSTGSHFFAVNTDNYSRATQSNYDGGYGFGFPERRIVLNGNDIYFASRRFNASDLTQILNTYSSTPLFANNKYVITRNFVYDKNSGEALMDLPYNVDLAAMSGDTVFLYNSSTKTINKYNSVNDLNLLTKVEISPKTIIASAGQTTNLSATAFFSDNRTSDITDRVKFTIDNPDIARISGRTVTALNAGQATITATYQGMTSTSTITVSAPDMLIDNMIADNSKQLIYAISKVKYELDVINMNTLSFVNKIKFSSSPSDIYFFNGTIYVSLPYEKKIATIDPTTMTMGTCYNTTADAYSIAVEDGKLLYATQIWFSYIYELDLTTGVDKLTNLGIVSEPDLEIDPVKHILYVGESGSSGSDFFAVNTDNYSRVTQSNYDGGYGFGFPERRVVLNGNDIYFASRRFNASDLTQIWNTYSSTPLFANDKYIVTNNAVYDLSGKIIVNLPANNQIDFCIINKQGNLIYYNKNSKSLYKYNAVEPQVTSITLSGPNNIIYSVNNEITEYYTTDFYDQYGYYANPVDVIYNIYKNDNETTNGVSIDEYGKLIINEEVTSGTYKVKVSVKNNPLITDEILVSINKLNLGDLNKDNIVNMEDALMMKDILLGKGTCTSIHDYDLDNDNKITSRDYAILISIIKRTQP